MLDLSEHREKVRDACIEADFLPKMMEYLPSRDAGPIPVSLEMVNKADVYIIVLASRYGFVPKGSDISITEMEFNRAIERKIEIFTFVIHESHPNIAGTADEDVSAQEKLTALKKRASEGRFRKDFKSPDDLSRKVLLSLLSFKERQKTAISLPSNYESVPSPPTPFVPHPYALMETKGLVGRKDELRLLADWNEGNPTKPIRTPLLVISAIGGMGKSALAWTWFSSVVSGTSPPNASLWWSFYECDASFDNFVVKALCYFGCQTDSSVRQMLRGERIDALFGALDNGQNLLVLDGLERLLLAYSRQDCSKVSDDKIVESTEYRRTGDVPVGRFLKRLAHLKQARVLVTTRLLPKDLETPSGNPIPGCQFERLEELCDEDCVSIWKSLGCFGSKTKLLETFRSFGRNPLLIRPFAAVVARFRIAPGNFDSWSAENLHLLPSQLSSVDDARDKILRIALDNLPENCWSVLDTLTLLRMPADYDLLLAVHARPTTPESTQILDNVLTELEERGLMGWNRIANQYDLHPVIRSFVFARMQPNAKETTLGALAEHFKAAPSFALTIKSKGDMAKPVELYNVLSQLGRFDDAFRVLCSNRYESGLYRYFGGRECVSLLTLLFPRGIKDPHGVSDASHRATALCMLSNAYHLCGDPISGQEAVEQQVVILKTSREEEETIGANTRLAWASWTNGKYYQAESISKAAVNAGHAINDGYRAARAVEPLAVTLATRGQFAMAHKAIALAKRYDGADSTAENRIVSVYLSMLERNWQQALVALRSLIDTAKTIDEENLALIHSMTGECLIALGQLGEAENVIHAAIGLLREQGRVIEECSALADLATCQLCRNDVAGARESLEKVWPVLEFAKTPIETSKAFLALSRLEEMVGNRQAAIDAGQRAFKSAWCQGRMALSQS